MENKKFTKDDLKVGYVVKLRNGDTRMVMPQASGSLVVTDAKGFWSFLSDYRDDLTFDGIKVCDCCDHDIMEVYGLADLGAYTVNFDSLRRKLLWKREEEKTCDSCAHKVVCTHVGMCEHYMEKAK